MCRRRIVQNIVDVKFTQKHSRLGLGHNWWLLLKLEVNSGLQWPSTQTPTPHHSFIFWLLKVCCAASSVQRRFIRSLYVFPLMPMAVTKPPFPTTSEWEKARSNYRNHQHFWEGPNCIKFSSALAFIKLMLQSNATRFLVTSPFYLISNPV